MKKSLIMIAAAATLFAACGDNDSFKEIKNQGENGNSAINFAIGSDKLTRGDNAAENSEALYTWTFYQHQSDFEVWGYKIVDPANAVFGANDGAGTVVTVTENQGAYEYSYATATEPLRFWDKTSLNYQFYAASPANADWTFNYTGATTTAYGAGSFETSAALNGVNLQSTTNNGPSAALKNTFKTATLANGTTKDIDKMIAAPCQVNQPSYNKPNPDAVHLNFIHILSKLNVTIKTDLDANLYEVKLLEFEVKNMPGKGDFDEATEAADHTKKNSRWDLSNYTYSDKIDYLTGLTSSSAIDVTSTKKYIVESLVIPQDVNYERVALDGQHHDEVNKEAVLFADYEEYAQANPIEALTEEQFNAIKNNANASDADKAKITKVQAVQVDEYDAVANTSTHSSEPYFMIKYTINGEPFTAYYNLVAAFNGLTNNETDFQTQNVGKDVLGFYEGWQNTLNINIHPTEIEFTADIADWSTAESADFKIEKGNY